MLEIGSSLRDARGVRGLALADAEAATMIRVRYLEALEDDRFELLPAGPYPRSFLREYAEFLGLNGDIYANEYDLRFPPPEPEPADSAPPPGLRLARLLDGLRPTRPLVAVAAVVLVGVAVWRLGGSSGTRTLIPAPTPTATQVQGLQTSPSPTFHPKTSSQPIRPPTLTLTATRGNCWLLVQIASRAGRTVYERTLQPGQTVRFGLSKPLSIRVGAPWNLDATIGRRSVTAVLPSVTGDILATASGLRPAP